MLITYGLEKKVCSTISMVSVTILTGHRYSHSTVITLHQMTSKQHSSMHFQILSMRSIASIASTIQYSYLQKLSSSLSPCNNDMNDGAISDDDNDNPPALEDVDDDENSEEGEEGEEEGEEEAEEEDVLEALSAEDREGLLENMAAVHTTLDKVHVLLLCLCFITDSSLY